MGDYSNTIIVITKQGFFPEDAPADIRFSINRSINTAVEKVFRFDGREVTTEYGQEYYNPVKLAEAMAKGAKVVLFDMETGRIGVVPGIPTKEMAAAIEQDRPNDIYDYMAKYLSEKTDGINRDADVVVIVLTKSGTIDSNTVYEAVEDVCNNRLDIDTNNYIVSIVGNPRMNDPVFFADHFLKSDTLLFVNDVGDRFSIQDVSPTPPAYDSFCDAIRNSANYGTTWEIVKKLVERNG